jgi:hypothetical protein
MLLMLSELLGPARPRHAPRKDVERLEEFEYRPHDTEEEGGWLDSLVAKETESADSENTVMVDVKEPLHTSALQGSTGDKCSICLNAYEGGERLRMLKCKHAYHKDCLDNWWVATFAR